MLSGYLQFIINALLPAGCLLTINPSVAARDGDKATRCSEASRRREGMKRSSRLIAGPEGVNGNLEGPVEQCAGKWGPRQGRSVRPIINNSSSQIIYSLLHYTYFRKLFSIISLRSHYQSMVSIPPVLPPFPAPWLYTISSLGA